jgi:hypothetical protein
MIWHSLASAIALIPPFRKYIFIHFNLNLKEYFGYIVEKVLPHSLYNNLPEPFFTTFLEAHFLHFVISILIFAYIMLKHQI